MKAKDIILKLRRDNFLAQMEEGVAIFPAAQTLLKNRDTTYKYRQESNFYYLTQYEEPDSILVLSKSSAYGNYILFIAPKNEKEEVWTGYRYAPAEAKKLFNADSVFETPQFEGLLPELLKDKATLYYALGYCPDYDRTILAAVNALKRRNIIGISAPYRIVDPNLLLNESRVIKDELEVRQIKQAAQITKEAFSKTIPLLKPGLFEYEIAANLEYHYLKNGACPGFPTIIASGNNATCLHYEKNTRLMQGDELVLIDSGAEYNYLNADVSRTFPLSGRFNKYQRNIYSLVLAAQKEAISKAKPNNVLWDIHLETILYLTEGLLQLGILKGNLKEILQAKQYEAFYMHRTSHFLGMDPHDVGYYRHEVEDWNQKVGWPDQDISTTLKELPVGIEGQSLFNKINEEGWVKLRPGMIVTVEPGLYLNANNMEVPEPYRGIGVRIEDDILITKDGCINLTEGIPKEIAEIEELLRHD